MKKKCKWECFPPGSLSKILLRMKLLTFFLFVSMVTATASSYSQQTKFNLKLNGVTVGDVFREIEANSEFILLYNEKQLDANRKVDVKVENETVESILDQLFKDTRNTYKIYDRQIVILAAEAKASPVVVQSETGEQQKKELTGTVKDSKGLTLPGVTVVVKGTTTGTIVDNDGHFRLSVPAGAQTLVFSFVGMKSQEFPIAGITTFNVVMEEATIGLEEIVAIGYGTRKKKDLTGSISSIKLENSVLETLPNVNLLDALKGSLPGFNVGAVSSAGSNPSFSIRGQNSVRASQTPLVVVDGVVYIGSFNEINPMDIASVDVLKDASSTAIYGSLAANGVIQITTKRGKTDKPIVQLNVTGGTQTYTKRPDMLSPEGYIQLRKDRFLADNPTGIYDINTNLGIYELDAYKSNHTVDWFDEVTRVAPYKNYSMNVSGLTQRSNYYVSADYMDQKGIVVGDQFHKFSVLGKIESKITDWLKIGITLAMTSKNGDGIPAELRIGTIDGPYSYKYVHDRGTTNPGFENFPNQIERYPQGQTTTASPLWRTQEDNQDRNQNYRSTSFLRIDAPWVKGLSYTFNYSLNRWENHSAGFQHENMFINTMILSDLVNPTSHLVEANGYVQNQGRTDWYMNHLINYNTTVGDHSFDATLMAERQGLQEYFTKVNARDFSGAGTSVLGVNAMELGNSANYVVDTNFGELYQLAYMGRLNYVYKERYHANMSIRQDGYSGYAEGHKYGIFRAGSLAWTASEEPFVKDNYKFIDNLKFRLSLGENGNPSVGHYATFPTINSSTTILLGGITSKATYASNLANKNVDWEKTTALNFGIDFSVFKNVLSGSFEIYNSNTTNLLLNRSIPIFNGFTTVLDNIGKINNKGIEIQLNSKNYATKNFTWRSGLNFWLNRNKVVSLYGLDANKDGVEDDDVASGYFIGKSLGANYTYVFDGIIQKDDAAYIAVYGGQPGDIKFKDLNGDGKIEPLKDRTIVGYSKPNFTMTLSNTLTYKNFELYFLFNYIAGGGKDNYFIGNNLFAYFPNALGGGSSANWLNKAYWTPDNPSNTVTRTNYNNSSFGYAFPKPRDFVRLQDISFSYNLPEKLLKKTPLSAMKVYASGKNLLTFSNWEGMDPETGTQYADTDGFPVFKIITVGLNVTF